MSTTTPRGNASVLAPYKAAILSAASKYGVDPVILGSIILHESGGHPGVVNPNGGASGLTQIFPSAHPEFSLSKLRGTDAGSIQYQIDAGAQVLKSAMDAHPGNTTAALQAYAGNGYTGPQGQSFRDELIGGYTGPVSAVLGVDGGDFLKKVTGAISPLNPFTGDLNPLAGNNPFSSAGDALSGVGNAIGWFSDPQNVVRILMGLVGVALVVGGLIAAASGRAESSPTVQAATQAAVMA